MNEEHPVQTYYRKKYNKYMAKLNEMSVDDYMAYLKEKHRHITDKLVMIDGHLTLPKEYCDEGPKS